MGNHKFLLGTNINIRCGNIISTKYNSLIRSYNYSIKNNMITRPVSSSLIDHIISNVQHTAAFTIEYEYSDHNLILTSIEKLPAKSKSTPAPKIHSTIDFDRVTTELSELFDDLEQFDNFTPNALLSIITSSITHVVKKYTTFKTTTHRAKQIECPWFTKEVFKLSCYKKKLLKKKKGASHDDNLTSEINILSKKIKNLKKSLKTSYFENKFSNINNSKNMWREMNAVLGRKKSNQSIEKLIKKSNGATLKEENEIVNELNNFFSTVGSNLASKCFSRSDKNTEVSKMAQNSIFLRPTSTSEIYNIINYLDLSKATGCDGISNLILKKCSNAIVGILALLINKCLSSGEYPDQLKIARVCPVFKSGLKTDCTNYRPISILPNLNKIFEKVIYSRTYNFLIETHFFFAHQYGFRKKSDTSIAILKTSVNLVHHFLAKSLLKR